MGEQQPFLLDYQKGRRVLTQSHNQQGVTLVELIVGIAILAILLAVGAPSLSSWIQNSQIRTAAEAMQNGLQLARAEAVRRNTSVQFVLGTASSWTVGCVTAVADNDADGVEDCPNNIQSRNSAEGSTNAVVAATQSTLVFNGLGRIIPASNVNIDITNPTGGTCIASAGAMRCLRIVVSTSGQVRMCDPAIASTDPRGC